LPPPQGQLGQWQLETSERGIIARFNDNQGKVCGFVLQGDQVDQRQQLLAEMISN